MKLMKIFDTILPEKFETWIQFYDFLWNEIPKIRGAGNEYEISFRIPLANLPPLTKSPSIMTTREMNELIDSMETSYIDFRYQLGYIRAQCFIEIENLRPTSNDQVWFISTVHQAYSQWNDSEEKINTLLNKLLKQKQ